VLALTASVALVSSASAGDPGVWLETGRLTEPASYRQGITSNPATGDVFFDGPFVGLYRTRGGAKVLASNADVIPSDVSQREQYNHIGDPAFDPGQGVLLPLESYQPAQPDPNPSKTGSIGVVDATSLAWKYYVKLDPSEIQKAQWIATDAAAGLFWTISGHDLLAYRLADINPANAAPNAAPIHSVKRLIGAAPSGVGGAVVYGGRIFLSTQVDSVDQIASVDTTTGASRVEVERPGTAEPEGLDFGPYLGGVLHWEIVPGGGLSSTQLLSFVPTGARLALRLDRARLRGGRKVTLSATVTVRAGGFATPLRGAQVRIAGHNRKTDAAGRAKLTLRLTRGGYRAQAFYKGLRTATRTVRAV
jgi:hypothetical protein